LRGLTFHYPGTDRPVLTGVDIDLPAGATVALIGDNGSGKTTLVKLLLGMNRPDEGQLLVDGVPLSELDPVAWGRTVQRGIPGLRQVPDACRALRRRRRPAAPGR
jgi:ABC-type bacteriocin/lantibiotic exporter with double-glycine peptidase domain